VLTENRASATRRIDLLSLVDQLEELVDTSKRLPLSDLVMVSSEHLLYLVDAIRGTIPQDVIEAERILQERHRLVEDAREEAERLLAAAREQSLFMLQDHHIVKAAELKADRLKNQAQQEADEILASADEWIQEQFGHLEEEALRLAGEIRRAATRRS
jgi:vacuolar-type H+-ATPase subunit H